MAEGARTQVDKAMLEEIAAEFDAEADRIETEATDEGPVSEL